jgi:hypothetical protein
MKSRSMILELLRAAYGQTDWYGEANGPTSAVYICERTQNSMKSDIKFAIPKALIRFAIFMAVKIWAVFCV